MAPTEQHMVAKELEANGEEMAVEQQMVAKELEAKVKMRTEPMELEQEPEQVV